MRCTRIPVAAPLVASMAAALSLVGCGPTTGPGSETDATRFALKRLQVLEQPTVSRDAEGKWHKSARELRNETGGFDSGTYSRTTAITTYEYRMLESASFDTKEEAEAAPVELADEDWKQVSEVFDFMGGQWSLKESTETSE